MEIPRYELKINAYAPGELAALVEGLAQQLSGRVKAHIEEKAVSGLEHPIATKIKEEVKAEKEEPAKRGRKPKTEVVEESPVEEVKVNELAITIMEEATAPSTPITKEQIAQALQSVSEKVNFQKAKEILSSFNKEDGTPCKKVSDIQSADYASFIDACEKAL